MNLDDNFIAVKGDGDELPSGYVKYPLYNTAHKFHNDSLSWDKAREVCRSEGADLAVAVTPQKVKYIVNIAGTTDTWIGIFQVFEPDEQWIRVDTGEFSPNPVFL